MKKASVVVEKKYRVIQSVLRLVEKQTFFSSLDLIILETRL